MADATSTFDRPPPTSQPRDWAQAFAALPEASPPADAWPALAARARQAGRARHRRAWRSGVALAATLACAAVGGVLWSMQDGMPEAVDAMPTRGAATATAAPAEAAASAARVADAGDASQARDAARAVTDPQAAGAADAPAAVAASAGRTPLPGPRRGERPRRATLPRPPTAETLSLPVERRLAGAAPGNASDAGAGTVAGADIPSPSVAVSDAQASPGESVAAADDALLQRLQARSAQLEAWLTLLRDPSVGTGPGALIAAELDDRLAGIDAALAVVPNDGADVQRELWQARVAALQRALVFESELRALAAEGRAYDGALVAVD